MTPPPQLCPLCGNAASSATIIATVAGPVKITGCLCVGDRTVIARHSKLAERMAKARGLVPPPLWHREYLGQYVEPSTPGPRSDRVDALVCARQALASKPINPLDVEHDGWRLGHLIEAYESSQREGRGGVGWAMAGGLPAFTPAQRAAVSAHWSAQLRAKVAATVERERNQVLVDPQDEP